MPPAIFSAEMMRSEVDLAVARLVNLSVSFNLCPIPPDFKKALEAVFIRYSASLVRVRVTVRDASIIALFIPHDNLCQAKGQELWEYSQHGSRQTQPQLTSGSVT